MVTPKKTNIFFRRNLQQRHKSSEYGPTHLYHTVPTLTYSSSSSAKQGQQHHQQQRCKSSLSLSQNPIITLSLSSFCHFFSVFNGCPHKISALNNCGSVQVSIFLIYLVVKKIPNRKSLVFFLLLGKTCYQFHPQTLLCEIGLYLTKAFFFSFFLLTGAEGEFW